MSCETGGSSHTSHVTTVRVQVWVILTVHVNGKVSSVALPDDVGGNAGVEPCVVSVDGVDPVLRAPGDLLQSGHAATLGVDVLVPADARLGVGVHLAVQYKGVTTLDERCRGRGGGDYRHVGNNCEERELEGGHGGQI